MEDNVLTTEEEISSRGHGGCAIVGVTSAKTASALSTKIVNVLHKCSFSKNIIMRMRITKT